MITSMKRRAVELPASPLFFFICKARFFAGLFFGVFFTFDRDTRLKQLQPVY